MIKKSKTAILKQGKTEYPSLDLKEQFQTYLKLDWEYSDGQGDWLFAEREDVLLKVLDLTGSYGINLLGHKNEILINEIKEKLDTWPPAMVQASRKCLNEKLSERIRHFLEKETRVSEWTMTWTNSGAETIEAAVKLCFLDYKKRLEKTRAAINYSINFIQWCLDNQKTEQLKAILEPTSFRNALALINLFQEQLELLKTTPALLHLENSFHGKTLGALSMLDNPVFKAGIPPVLKTIALSTDSRQILNVFNSLQKTCYVLDPRNKRLISKSFLPVAGLFVEAIQGEGGIREPGGNALRTLRNLCNQSSVPMIADEIQSGLFRTGSFAALSRHEVVADVYCFGKALGGGIAKTGVLCCRNAVFPKVFSWMHSSSFAGDTFSANVAMKVLDVLEQARPGIRKHRFHHLKSELIRLQKRYPEVIKEIRGRGLMLAIELHEPAVNTNFTSKYFKDLRLIGYWLASVFLNREQIRIFPTLSAPLSFRIEPSIYFGQAETEFMVQGISNFCEAILRYDLGYLFGHIMEVNENSSVNLLPENVYTNIPPKGAAFFICHPVDVPHIQDIIKLTCQIPDNELTSILVDLADQQEFTIYHVDQLKNKAGQSIDLVFLGIPITSKAYYNNLRKGKKDLFIKKIQNAVDFANRYDAKVIGLGQFTSIISNNGLALDPGNSILTTGNSYTVWLTLRAIQQACIAKNWNIEEKTVSVIGAAGNILSVLSAFLTDHVTRIILIHRKAICRSSKFKASVISILKEVLRSESKTPLVLNIRQQVTKNNWDVDADFHKIIEDKTVSEYLMLSSDTNSVADADIIVAGTNSTVPLIENHMVKPGAILVDVAVPSNVEPAAKQRADVLYIKGGMAALPKSGGQIQHLDSVILPFGAGQSYACMAETFGIALDGDWPEHNIGDLTKSKILRIAKLMEAQGFELDGFKRKDSY